MALGTGVYKVYSGFKDGTLYFWHTSRHRTDANTIYALSSAGLVLGVSGSGADFKLWGDTPGDYVFFDETNDRMDFKDITLRMMDDTPIAVGDGLDFTFKWNHANSRAEILPASANSPLWFGDGSTNPDVRFAGSDATNNIYLDVSEDQMRFTGIDIEMQGTAKVLLNDTGTYVNSSVDGQLDLVSDDVVYINGNLQRKQATETLSANKTFTLADAPVQFLDPGGAGRTLFMPATSTAARFQMEIINTADAGESFDVNTAAGTTILTIGQNESGQLVCNGVKWGWSVGKAT